MNEVDIKHVKMASLGRRFQLGDLYNYRTDNIIKECKMFDVYDLPSASQIKTNFKLEINCPDSETHKWEHMKLDEHLQASILSGIIENLEGASHYVTDRDEPTQVTRTFICRSESMKKRLDLPTLFNHNVQTIPRDLSDATHVVVGIVYGLEVYCVLIKDLQDLETRKEAEKFLSDVSIKMKMALEDNQDIAMFEEHFDIEGRQLIRQLKCRVYSDLQAQPLCEFNIFDAYTLCLKSMKQVKTEAVPIRVTLCPLKLIFDSTGKIRYRDVDAELIARCRAISTALQQVIGQAEGMRNKFKKAILSLPNYSEGCTCTSICKVAREFQTLRYSYEEADLSLGQFTEVVSQFQEFLKAMWKTGIVQARRNEDSKDDEVEKAVTIAETHPLFNFSSLTRWLQFKEAELEMVAQISHANHPLGICLLSSNTELAAKLDEVKNNKSEFSFVLVIPKITEWTNENLSAMENGVRKLFQHHGVAAHLPLLSRESRHYPCLPYLYQEKIPTEFPWEQSQHTTSLEEDEDSKFIPWFMVTEKRHQVMDKIHELVEHVKRYSESFDEIRWNDVVSFYIVPEGDRNISEHYYLFQADRLTVIDRLSFPTPPTGLHVQEVKDDQDDMQLILVKWDVYKDVGYPCTFVVEFRQEEYYENEYEKDETETGWMKRKTAKPGNTQMIIYKRRKSAMQIRMFVTTHFGRSEFSDIILIPDSTAVGSPPFERRSTMRPVDTEKEKELFELISEPIPSGENIKKLIDEGVNINCSMDGKFEESFLKLLSCDCPNLLEIVHFFVRNQVDVNATDELSRNALYYLARNCRNSNVYDIVRLLVENGIDVNACNESGWNVLGHLKAHYQNDDLPKIIEFVIENGVDLDNSEKECC